MASYEYRIVPAPRKAKRVRGAKTGPDRMAALLTETLNAEARQGWEFVRSESLPLDEKPGMLSSPREAYHSYLVFRRPIGGGAETGPLRLESGREGAPSDRSRARLAPESPSTIVPPRAAPSSAPEPGLPGPGLATPAAAPRAPEDAQPRPFPFPLSSTRRDE